MTAHHPKAYGIILLMAEKRLKDGKPEGRIAAGS